MGELLYAGKADNRKIRTRRSLIASYYPVLVLNDRKSVFINKASNSAVNQDFKKIPES